MKKYRTYSSDFKRELIAQIDSGEATLSGAARENNISPSLIERWREQLHKGTFHDRPTPREKQLEKELDKYKKKVGELTVQMDLLKKLQTNSAYMKKSNGFVITPKKPDPSAPGAK